MRAAVATTALLALLGPGLLACGAETGSGAAPSSATPDPQTSPSTGDVADQEDDMRIRLTIGDATFGATLHDSAAGRDLVAQLPVTLEMRDHGSVEKTGPLPSPLSLDGQPAGADPDVGDLGYYAPGNDLVLYYGDQSYFDGIVVLGRLDDGAADTLAAMTGTITATVTADDA